MDIEAGTTTNLVTEGDAPRKAPEPTDLPIFSDESTPLYSMYNETAQQDQTMAEIWQSDINSSLVVTGLFSVMVAILLARSYQDLTFNSQDVSAFYLSQIYRINAGSSGSTAPLPVNVPDPSTSSPAILVVWVNALWSLSLVMSIACTLFATLLQQWARRYLRTTQEPRGPRNRARIRELMVRGIERSQFSRMAPLLPAMFHLSIFLFLGGLVIFLFRINHPIFWAILGSVTVCVVLYLSAGLLPILRYDSPYYTPLFSLMSHSLWLTFNLLYQLSKRLGFIGSGIRLGLLGYTWKFHAWTLRNMAKDVEDLARTHSSTLDTSVILRTFDSIDGDQNMQAFLACIPGFYRSSKAKNDGSTLEKFNGEKLPPVIVSFMNHSLSSVLLPEKEKGMRIALCLGAMNADALILQCTLRHVLQTPESLIFNNLNFVRFAQSQTKKNDVDPWVKDYARCIVGIAINRIQNYNNNDWVAIVRQHPGLSKVRLRQSDYHSLRLRNLISTTRLLMESRLKDSDQFERGGIWHNVLTEVCKVDILKAQYGPQREFFNLWNELKAMANSSTPPMVRSNATHVLSVIRDLYVPIHQRFSPTKGDQESASVPFPRPTHTPAAIAWPGAKKKKNIWSREPTPSPPPSLPIQATWDQSSHIQVTWDESHSPVQMTWDDPSPPSRPIQMTWGQSPPRSVSPPHPAAIGWKSGKKKNRSQMLETPSPQSTPPIETTRDQSPPRSDSPHDPSTVASTSAKKGVWFSKQTSSHPVQTTRDQSSRPSIVSISPYDPSTVASTSTQKTTRFSEQILQRQPTPPIQTTRDRSSLPSIFSTLSHDLAATTSTNAEESMLFSEQTPNPLPTSPAQTTRDQSSSPPAET